MHTYNRDPGAVQWIQECIVETVDMVAGERTFTKTDNRENRKQEKSNPLSEPELMKQPEGFPPSTLKLLLHEPQYTSVHNTQFGEGVTFHERIIISMEECDTMAFRSCREIEAPFCDYIETQYN
ncbi:hypothetical protein GIB67_029621 [Kingdonia uniflora]|uniref:Uncharacterized protein n=1 Tax=Kingdonia uniflora TaxID=39325 RepID=A0A7J7LLM3_9MAGN|nr:hypothetical protein GIB67_029621 [Kingdonia uniflora]